MNYQRLADLGVLGFLSMLHDNIQQDAPIEGYRIFSVSKGPDEFTKHSDAVLAIIMKRCFDHEAGYEDYSIDLFNSELMREKVEDMLKKRAEELEKCKE